VVNQNFQRRLCQVNENVGTLIYGLTKLRVLVM